MLVGGVDDGVDVELGDVPLEQLEQGLVHLEGYAIVRLRDVCPPWLLGDPIRFVPQSSGAVPIDPRSPRADRLFAP